MLSWLDEEPEKNYKDSDLTLLLNGDETLNSHHGVSFSIFLWGLAHCTRTLQADQVLWLGM